MDNEKYGLIIGNEYYSNNYGIFKLIAFTFHPEYNNSNKTMALIKFKITGYECEAPLISVRRGIVRDKLLNHTIPIDIYNIPIKDREDRLLNIIKPVWKGIIKRCYDTKSINYDRYGTKGISVCNEWKNFNTFYNDLPLLPQYEKWYRYPTLYNIDKDFIAYKNNIPFNQIYYSKETCMFLHYMDNTNLRSIEYRNHNKNTLTSKYFGVDSRIVNGELLYRPRLYVGGKEMYFGWFKDEKIAAAVYNYHYLKYHEKFPRFELIPLLNDVPYVDPKDFIKYNMKPKIVIKRV